MSDNNSKKEFPEKNGWTLYRNDDGKYEEKICFFYNMAVIFSIKFDKRAKASLSFTRTSEAHNAVWCRYKVKGSVDYAKKIVENIVKLFDNIPVDCDDIDLCLRKAFLLRKINARTIFPRLTRRITQKQNIIRNNKGE